MDAINMVWENENIGLLALRQALLAWRAASVLGFLRLLLKRLKRFTVWLLMCCRGPARCRLGPAHCRPGSVQGPWRIPAPEA